MADGKSDALDFYIAAKGFKEAIKMVHEHPRAAENPGLIFLPVQTLLGFALELYFKAWLEGAGRDEDALRKAYGHNLTKLFADCLKESLPTIPRLDETVAQTEDSHGDYTYRYFKRSKTYKAMGMMTVLAVLDSLDEVVDQKLGASTSMGLTPGH
ncbi:hypothetical protein BH11PSE5_BH11PSE5_08780 [soil metagenome]